MHVDGSPAHRQLMAKQAATMVVVLFLSLGLEGLGHLLVTNMYFILL
jgi:hypothetical protein